MLSPVSADINNYGVLIVHNTRSDSVPYEISKGLVKFK